MLIHLKVLNIHEYKLTDLSTGIFARLLSQYTLKLRLHCQSLTFWERKFDSLKKELATMNSINVKIQNHDKVIIMHTTILFIFFKTIVFEVSECINQI